MYTSCFPVLFIFSFKVTEPDEKDTSWTENELTGVFFVLCAFFIDDDYIYMF